MAGLLQFDPNDPANALMAGPDLRGVQTLTPTQAPVMTPDQIASVKMAPTGLSGLLSGLKDATYTPDTNGMTFWDKLGAFGQTLQHAQAGLDGRSIGGADPGMATIQAFKDKVAAAQRRQELMATADQLGMTPREKLIFLSNPEEWAKNNASRLGFHDVAAGNTAMFGDPNDGGSSIMTDKYFQNGNVTGKQTPTGTQNVQSGPLNADQQAALINARNSGVKVLGPTDSAVDVGAAVNPSAVDQPRGIRNNNPLNITGSGWNGQIGSDGQYAKFSTPEAGFAAADQNLQAYANKHGINTVAGIVSRWAPPGDNNPTGAYTQYVAKKLGIDPNQPLNLSDPNVRRQVLSTMSEFELGRQSAPAAPRTLVQGTPPAPPRILSPAEVKAAGFPDGSVVQAKPTGLEVVYKPPASSEKLPTQTLTNLAAIEKDAERTQRLGEMADRFMTANQKRKSGGVVESLIPGGLAYEAQRDPEIGQMFSINNIGAQLMREIGSGPLRNQELTMFKQGFLSPQNTGDVNSTIASGIKESAARAKQYAAFARDWANSHADQPDPLAGMDAAFAAKYKPTQREAAAKMLQDRSKQYQQNANSVPAYDINGQPIRGR